MHARFDDLRPGARRSFRLHGHACSLVATRLDQVRGVLRAAQDHVAAGRWVAGWVAYEAAPAFDPAFQVRTTVGTDVRDFPLARFEVYTTRAPAGEPPVAGYDVAAWVAGIDQQRYIEDIDAIRAHIREGDTYQVNHTFRSHARFSGDPQGLYGDLCRAQNAAYGAYLDSGDWVVASASPELFFDWDSRRILVMPMKGTTARGVTSHDDLRQRSWLADSAKNRAENVMILDMVRNDLSRLAVTGTLTVPALFTTEKYDTVWQLTSTATAQPRPDVDLVDVFTALFPCASITGAPKASTMAIIAQREVEPRGVYCGAIGFGGPEGTGHTRWVFNVGIRTVLISRPRGLATYGTGGGITYDSTAADEYAEAQLKAAVLTRSANPFQLLETMRWDPRTRIHRWHEHMDRLRGSAEYFGIPLRSAQIQAAIAAAIAEHPQQKPLRVRLVLHRDGRPEITVTTLPPAAAAPLVLAIDTVPIDPVDPFIHHKTTYRAHYVAAAARHPDCDDVILVNPTGHITETTIGNLGVQLGERWVTPPTSAGCLPGTERAALLRQGVISEGDVTVAQLRDATALARINSVHGWQPATLRAPPSPLPAPIG